MQLGSLSCNPLTLTVTSFCDGIADANQRQKQLLKEHFEELGSEEGDSEDEEDDRRSESSSMDEFSGDEDGRQRVGSCLFTS